jgi:hypothetical protein
MTGADQAENPNLGPNSHAHTGHRVFLQYFCSSHANILVFSRKERGAMLPSESAMFHRRRMLKNV